MKKNQCSLYTAILFNIVYDNSFYLIVPIAFWPSLARTMLRKET